MASSLPVFRLVSVRASTSLPPPQMAKTWHPKHKGLAMGLTNSGAAIGGMIWPVVFAFLVDTMGFRKGVCVLAGIAGLLSLFVVIFAVPAPDCVRRSIGDPYDIKTWWPFRAFRSRTFITHIVSMAFIYLGVLAIPFFIELWARRNKTIGVSEDTKSGNGLDLDVNHSSSLGLYLVITLNACQLPGRIFGSALCDKFQARKIHAIACFVAATIVGCSWFLVSSFDGGEIFVACFGLLLGVMVSLPINDVQDLLGNDRTHLLGEFAGAVYTCCCPFILAGAVITGTLVNYFDVSVAPGAWCVACFVLGGCGIVIGLWMEDDTGCFEDGPRGSTSEIGGSTRVNSVDAGVLSGVGLEEPPRERKHSWSMAESPV